MQDAILREDEPQAQSAPDYESDQRITWYRQHEDDPIRLVGDRLLAPRFCRKASSFFVEIRVGEGMVQDIQPTFR